LSREQGAGGSRGELGVLSQSKSMSAFSWEKSRRNKGKILLGFMSLSQILFLRQDYFTFVLGDFNFENWG
jgi:hypothetical protein